MNIYKMLRVAFLSILLVACTADTMASAKVFVWLDKNGNGIFDGGEPPLPKVHVDSNGFADAITDKHGEASLGNFCANDCWRNYSITVETPDGFTPTTPTHLALTGYSGTYQFGFKLDPSKPTATP